MAVRCYVGLAHAGRRTNLVVHFRSEVKSRNRAWSRLWVTAAPMHFPRAGIYSPSRVRGVRVLSHASRTAQWQAGRASLRRWIRSALRLQVGQPSVFQEHSIMPTKSVALLYGENCARFVSPKTEKTGNTGYACHSYYHDSSFTPPVNLT